MANQKFSDFSNQPPGAGTYLVGYDGVTNVRTLASNIGGGSGSDAWSFTTAITDFQPIEGFSYIGNLPENNPVYKPFRIEGTITLKNMGFLIQTLSTNLNHRLYGAVYKYDIATDTLNLQDYTGEMIVDTTSGVTGWNYVAFNGGDLTLDAGVYFSRVIAPSSIGQPVRIQTNFARNKMMGIVGTGTSTNAWYMFQQFTSYDFGSTPSSISLGSLTKTVSAPTVTGKPFYTITQP